MQSLAGIDYAEIHDNVIGEGCLPIDMLRCKLAIFGASKFDPKSDRWTRITLFQGAPLLGELDLGDARRLGVSRHPRSRRMIVSWNELQRTCQKTFRGLGVPAGADDDSSFAVLWLQARGLDALTPLDATLSALECAAPRPLRVVGREDGFDVLDAGGQPAVAVASDVLDLAVARAIEREDRAEVLLTGVEGGIFVAGALPQRPIPGRRARVEWRDGRTPRTLDVGSDHECRLSTALPHGMERTGGHRRDAVHIVIDESAGERWREQRSSWRIDADAEELARRAAHSVTHGIEVPEPLWSRLLGFAGRTLVPATRKSRERGAGGDDDTDND